MGIFVAIPAVVAYNVFQKKAGDIEAHAQSLARLVTAWLHTYPEARNDDEASETSAPVRSGSAALEKSAGTHAHVSVGDGAEAI